MYGPPRGSEVECQGFGGRRAYRRRLSMHLHFPSRDAAAPLLLGADKVIGYICLR